MYTEFEETKEGLIIRLNKLGLKELEDLKERHKKEGTLALWWDLNKGMFTDGYSQVRPEQIGALTSAPIISNRLIDEETTEEELNNTKIYWFPDYMIRDEVEELLTKGEVFFILASE